MKKVHFIMQAKGGVGKSFIAIILAQYLIEKKGSMSLFDTDPSNQTFFETSALNVRYIDLMSKNNYQVDIAKFDLMYSLILSAPNDVLIDSGSSSYIQLFSYLTADFAASMMMDDAIEMIVHVPVIGGESREVCFEKLYELVKALPDAKFVLWLNNYPTSVFKEVDDDCLEKEKYFIRSKDRLSAIVSMPEFNEGTFGYALKQLMDNHKLFNEVLEPNKIINFGNRPITSIEKFRLKIIKQKIWESISVLDELL